MNIAIRKSLMACASGSLKAYLPAYKLEQAFREEPVSAQWKSKLLESEDFFDKNPRLSPTHRFKSTPRQQSSPLHVRVHCSGERFLRQSRIKNRKNVR
jgi:hypothetical protein